MRSMLRIVSKNSNDISQGGYWEVFLSVSDDRRIWSKNADGFLPRLILAKKRKENVLYEDDILNSFFTSYSN